MGFLFSQARLGGQDDTEQTLIATPYWSPNKHYIHISTSTKSPTVGSYMVFNVETNSFTEHAHYCVSVEC